MTERSLTVSRTHVVCSTTAPTDPGPHAIRRSLGPLETLISYIKANGLELTRLVFISPNTADDFRYCAAAQAQIDKLLPSTQVVTDPRYAIDPLSIAVIVSEEVQRAQTADAELLVDLTPGPKDRTAAIYVAASAFPSVKVLYAQRGLHAYELAEVPPMGNFNSWLAHHGILVRDYQREISPLIPIVQQAGLPFTERDIVNAISDLLGSGSGFGFEGVGPRSLLLNLTEAIAKNAVPQRILGAMPDTTRKEDERIRAAADGWHRSAARAAQVLWQLRNMFAHPQSADHFPTTQDAIALLDCLSFLSSRLVDTPVSEDQMLDNGDFAVVAVDGDDIGRAFEERLAACISPEEMRELAQWSSSIQAGLASQMSILRESWDGLFLARTGDGFLAQVPAANMTDLVDRFRPTFINASATTGIGPTVKDAYIAMKLGKAKNRGGGLFYSFESQEERVLWLRT